MADETKTTKKTDKSKQIVHEAEITRQHARYKIPATIQIDGKTYKLEDWSVSGCAIENLPDEILHKKFASGKMIFRFDDFETIVDNIKLEFISRRPNGVVGCRFTELTPQQIAILNQIISSYLAGDIVTEDDIIHAVTRNITYEKKEKPKVDKKKSILILILIYSFVAFLLLFLFYVIYKRVYVVQTQNAFIDANITAIRAPAPSYIHYPKKLYVNQKVRKGDSLLSAYLVAGGVQKIASPIDGEILKIFALNGEFRNVAEPILYIFPENSRNAIYITAHVLHKDLIKLKIGDIATAVTPDGNEFYAKLVKIIPAQTIYLKKAKKLRNVYNQARNYDTLIFYTNYPLTKEMINKSIFLTIDTFLNRWGFLSLNLDEEDENKKEERHRVESYSNNNDNYYDKKRREREDRGVEEINRENYKNIVTSRNYEYKDNKKREYNKHYNYCIIVETDKYLSQSTLNKFFALFPNGKVDKINKLYVFSIPGFTSYESAKFFMRNRVNRYYKQALIKRCGIKK